MCGAEKLKPLPFILQSWPGAPGWPSQHYPVALMQADGFYDLEKNGYYMGDAGDLYSTTGSASVIGPQTVPNTNTYQSMLFDEGSSGVCNDDR